MGLLSGRESQGWQTVGRRYQPGVNTSAVQGRLTASGLSVPHGRCHGGPRRAECHVGTLTPPPVSVGEAVAHRTLPGGPRAGSSPPCCWPAEDLPSSVPLDGGHAQPPRAAVALQRPSWPRTVPPSVLTPAEPSSGARQDVCPRGPPHRWRVRVRVALAPALSCPQDCGPVRAWPEGKAFLHASPRKAAVGEAMESRRTSALPEPEGCGGSGWGRGGSGLSKGAPLRQQSGRADPVTTTVSEQAGCGQLPPGLGGLGHGSIPELGGGGRLPQPAGHGGECGAPLDGTGAERGTGRGSATQNKASLGS